MQYLDQDLNKLMQKGKERGYLTYDEINSYLPDEDVTPEKLDELLLALDEAGIQLLEGLVDKPERKPGPVAADAEPSRQTANRLCVICDSNLRTIGKDRRKGRIQRCSSCPDTEMKAS